MTHGTRRTRRQTPRWQLDYNEKVVVTLLLICIGLAALGDFILVVRVLPLPR